MRPRYCIYCFRYIVFIYYWQCVNANSLSAYVMSISFRNGSEGYLRDLSATADYNDSGAPNLLERLMKRNAVDIRDGLKLFSQVWHA